MVLFLDHSEHPLTFGNESVHRTHQLCIHFCLLEDVKLKNNLDFGHVANSKIKHELKRSIKLSDGV